MLLEEEELKNCPVLILSNKKIQINILLMMKLKVNLKIKYLFQQEDSGKFKDVLPFTGNGISEGFDWLTSIFAKK